MEKIKLIMSEIDIIDWKEILNRINALNNRQIELLVEAIISASDAEYIYKFARDVERAPIEKLAEAIIDIKDNRYTKGIYIYMILPVM